MATQLESAEAASNRARALTQQLLTLSQGGSPIRSRIAVDDLLRESVTVTLGQAPVVVDLDLSQTLHGVLADADQLSQVFNNLLANAAQAMPDGGSISISAENVQVDSSSQLALAPGSYVRVQFVDQGSGVPQSIRDRIFDPYFTTKQNGNGLGLATSYSIIKKH